MALDAMNTANWQITNGMTVFATDGTKVGTVRNYAMPAGYLDVHKGWLFAKDFYVPFSAVDTVTSAGVVLRLTKDELEQAHYTAPPAENAAPSAILHATGVPPAEAARDPDVAGPPKQADEPAHRGSGA